MNPALLMLVFIGTVWVLIAVVFVSIFRLWLQAFLGGARIQAHRLVSMKLRKVNASVIVSSRVLAVTAGVNVSIDQLEAHYLAGGDVLNVIKALATAKTAGVPLTFEDAAAMDLAGRDVMDMVQTSIGNRFDGRLNLVEPAEETGAD